jgi:predicted kinase
MSHLRCHLLIGPPASGKTTVALALQELLARSGPQPVVLSTDAIREELYGDPATQGPWHEVQAVLVDRLMQAVESEVPVIVDATHARRPWRLAMTQALELPRQVEWVGWWLTTPLETCQQWNQARPIPVPDTVIEQYHSALQDSSFGPENDEGFAVLNTFDPSAFPQDRLLPRLHGVLTSQAIKISHARNRTSTYELHAYSRLLDLERLFYLISLLSRFPGLEASDEQTEKDLLKLCNPLPISEDLAERATSFIRFYGECYADTEALRNDLTWLTEQGFTEGIAIRTGLCVPDADHRVESCLGCRPSLANRETFIRIMTLIRHVLQNPLDHPREPQQGNDRTPPLYAHLLEQLVGIPGSYQATWTDTLHKDLKLIRRYGLFQAKPARHGYTVGTAILTKPQLLELFVLVRQAAERLQDPSAQDLKKEFTKRLKWAGYPIDDIKPVRDYAIRAMVSRDHVPTGSLAVETESAKLEEAIVEGYPVLLEQYQDAALFEGQLPAVNAFRVWPLQLLFHNIGWYLAYETFTINGEPGLIKTQRVDRLQLVSVERALNLRHSPEQRVTSIERLEKLLEYCGGIYFGNKIEDQLSLCSDSLETRRSQLRTIRFRCTEKIFKFVREGVQRFPIECTRLSTHLPTDTWRHRPNIQATLEPQAGMSHPYPVEFDVPHWIIGYGREDGDVDLKRWLFGYDGGIVIEEPFVLKDRRIWSAEQVLLAHRQTMASAD